MERRSLISPLEKCPLRELRRLANTRRSLERVRSVTSLAACLANPPEDKGHPTTMAQTRSQIQHRESAPQMQPRRRISAVGLKQVRHQNGLDPQILRSKSLSGTYQAIK